MRIKSLPICTVRCCGEDEPEPTSLNDDENAELMAVDDQEDDDKKQPDDADVKSDAGEKKAYAKDEAVRKSEPIQCLKRVHASCLMERSKWKSLIVQNEVRGFCRTHYEKQNKLASIEKNLVLKQLIRDSESHALLLLRNTISDIDGVSTEMAVHMDGSRFDLSVHKLV